MPPITSFEVLRTGIVGSLAAVALGASAAVLGTSDARACGVFQEEPVTPTAGETPSVVTDHRIVVAVTPTMTTLWDQVEYAGDPAQFAWVLPARGGVTVGVGTDEFIGAIDDATAPEILSPRRRCASPRNNGCGGSSTAGCGSEDSSDMDFEPGYQEDAGVHVTRTLAGPYAVVRIHGDDPSNIVGFLRSHRFAVPTEIEPIVGKYVDEKFDFIAVRLRSGRGVGAMKPIRVSWSGSDARIPLRMARAGVGASVGLKIFVIGTGRWTTKNFPTFVVDPKSLTWDFQAQKSDYVSVRDRQAGLFDGRAFAMESSLDLPRLSLPEGRPDVPLPTDDDAGITDTGTLDTGTLDTGAPNLDAATDASSDGAEDAESDASDAIALDGGADTATAADTSSTPTYDGGKGPAVDPYMSDRELAFGNLSVRRVTRLRGDLPPESLDQDLELQLDENQGVYLRRLQVDKSTTSQVCPTTASVAGLDGDEGTAPIRATLGLVLAALGAVLGRRALRHDRRRD